MEFLRKLLAWLLPDIDSEPMWIDADYIVIDEGR